MSVCYRLCACQVCGGRRLWAHRAVLAVGSRYLRDVIASATRAHVIGDVIGDVTDDVSGDGDVSLPQHISLPTVDAQTCACALRYIYTGHVDVSLRRVNTLIDLSVTLQMPDLATACVAHMRASVDSATWRPIVATCAQYSLWGLLKEVVVFVARRVEVCELTCLSESVFTAVLSQWSGEVEWAVTALLTWASSDYDARRAAFSTLTQTTVHLSQLPPHTLHALLTPYLSHPISQHPAVLRSGGQDGPVTARVTSSSQLTSAGSTSAGQTGDCHRVCITTDVTPSTTTQPAWLYAPQQGTAQQAQYKVFENLTPYTEPAEFNSLVNQ